MPAFASHALGRRYQGRPDTRTLVRRVHEQLADVGIDLPGEVRLGVDRHEAHNATADLGHQRNAGKVRGGRGLQPPQHSC